MDNNTFDKIEEVIQKIIKEVEELKQLTERDYEEESNVNEQYRNQSIKLITLCKEMISNLKSIINIDTHDSRKSTLDTTSILLVKEMAVYIKNLKQVLENPYDHISSQLAQNSEEKVKSILEHISFNVKSWQENPPVEISKEENTIDSPKDQLKNNSNYMSHEEISPLTPRSMQRSINTPPVTAENVEENITSVIRLTKEILFKVKEKNLEAIEEVSKEISLILLQCVKLCNTNGWKDMAETLFLSFKEMIDNAKQIVTNQTDMRTLNGSIKSLLIKINQFMNKIKGPSKVNNLSQEILRRNSNSIPTPPPLPPQGYLEELKNTFAKQQKENETPQNEPKTPRIHPNGESVAEKIFEQFRSQFLNETQINENEKEKFLKKISEMVSQQISKSDKKEKSEKPMSRQSYFSSNLDEAEEDLREIEKNYANVISDMADWHKKMKSPFKFWRPTTIANELEVRNHEYVKFVQKLLDCNDSISGSVFDFIVQANLQVADPTSTKIRLKEATGELYVQFETVMNILKQYYPTENSQLALLNDCNDKLSKKATNADAVDQPTILAAVGRTTATVTSSLKRNLRNQCNDLRIIIIHLLSCINSTTSNTIESFEVLYICACIATTLEIISNVLITSNTCRNILLNPKEEEENFDLKAAFNNLVDQKTSLDLLELAEQTKTTQQSIWEEPPNNIIYTKETQQLEKKKIKAASLNHLVLELTSEKNYDRTFLKTFLATYRSFSTPAQLLTKLIERFNVPNTVKETVASQIKLRVAIVTKHWVENQFFDFDTQVLSMLTKFVKEKLLKNQNLNQVAKLLTNEIEKNDVHRLQKIKATFNVPPTDLQIPACTLVKYMDPVTLLNQFSALDIANQITLNDWEVFSKIEPSELLNQSWNKEKLKYRAPNVLGLIERMNRLSFFVPSVLLFSPNLKKRVEWFEKFIEIGTELRKLNNYSSLMAIMAGLGQSSAARLKFTKSSLSEKSKIELGILEELMSPRQSFKSYRSALQTSKIAIPYLVVFLQDLTFIEDGNPETIDGLTNFERLTQVYDVIEKVGNCQTSAYSFPIVEPIYTLCKTLPAFSNDKLLYSISLFREPREALKIEEIK